MQKISEEKREIPVKHETDAVVAGGRGGSRNSYSVIYSFKRSKTLLGAENRLYISELEIQPI